MIKNSNSKPGYCEEFDGEALREIADMAKLYVAKENGFDGKGSGVPNGSFSDFSCCVWEMFTEAVRYGMRLSERKKEREGLRLRIDYFKRKVEEFENFDNDWR